MRQLLGQGQGLLTPLHGLRRIAQTPQRLGRDAQAPQPRRLALAERLGALRRRVGESDPLLEVRPGRGVVAQVEQGRPERVMGLQAVRRGRPARWASRASCSPSSRAVCNAPRLR